MDVNNLTLLDEIMRLQEELKVLRDAERKEKRLIPDLQKKVVVNLELGACKAVGVKNEH